MKEWKETKTVGMRRRGENRIAKMNGLTAVKTVVMKDLTEKRIVEMRGLIEEKTVEMKSPIEERTEEMIEERTEEMIEKIVRMIEEVVKAKVKIEKMKKGVVIARNQLKAKIQSNRIRLKLNSALWILDALICSSILKRMVKKLA